ncbi:MAG: hypothetical protein P8189_16770 [Anaerolineae bacterium]
MRTNRIIRLSGWALILGGLAIVVGSLFGDEGLFFGLFLVMPIFVGAGMLGLQAGYKDALGNLGRTILWAGVLGAAVALVGAIGQMFWDEAYFAGTFFSLTGIFTSLLLFGVQALRRKLLPWGNGLPVLAGIWVPLIALLYGISEGFNVNLPAISNAVLVAVFLIMGLALLLLGYVVQADAASEMPANRAERTGSRGAVAP